MLIAPSTLANHNHQIVGKFCQQGSTQLRDYKRESSRSKGMPLYANKRNGEGC